MQFIWNLKSLYDNYRMNAINLQRLRFNMKKFNCINDNLSHKDIEGLVENFKYGEIPYLTILFISQSETYFQPDLQYLYGLNYRLYN